MELGIPAHQRGFSYLTTALEFVKDEPIYIDRTSDLYERLGMEYGATAAQIERCIRHSIESAFDHLAPEVINKYFRNSISEYKGKPVNSAFIATMALWLKGDEE